MLLVWTIISLRLPNFLRGRLLLAQNSTEVGELILLNRFVTRILQRFDWLVAAVGIINKSISAYFTNQVVFVTDERVVVEEETLGVLEVALRVMLDD